MRTLWSEVNRRRFMRRVWLALAETEAQAGLLDEEQIEELRATVDDVDLERSAEIETQTRHDVMAELLAWAEQAPGGGKGLHVGATSADITENVDVLRMARGLELIQQRLASVMVDLADAVERYASLPTMGWTHLQPASVTTVGYRLAVNLLDFVEDADLLSFVAGRLRGKGFKGPVGTRASYAQALAGSGFDAEWLDRQTSERLGLTPVSACGQVVPRKQDWLVLSALSAVGASASTFAFNIRLLQSPPFGEWAEEFAPDQVGSTAMPWKRNPIVAENVNSLARYLGSLPSIAWHNEAVNLLERTLDDSANRRIALPEAFLCADEILLRVSSLVRGFALDENAIAANLARFGPFAAAEAVLMAAAAAGGDRQALHERIRIHSLAAWAALAEGRENELPALLASDALVTRHVEPDLVRRLISDPAAHTGDAAAMARSAAELARGRGAGA
jgi:adenylosuccinate lyase